MKLLDRRSMVDRRFACVALRRARGYASRAILAAARTRAASVIVAGSHGAGATKIPLMDSAAEWLSRKPTARS